MKQQELGTTGGKRLAAKREKQENRKSADKPETDATKKKVIIVFVCLMALGVVFLAIAVYRGIFGDGGIKPPLQPGEKTTPTQTPNLDDPVSPAIVLPTPGDDDGERLEGVYTFILAGVDYDNANTDVLMVAKLDVTNGVLDILSIPRDTQVNVTRRIKRINGAWGTGGIEQLREELKWVIGFVPDYYVTIKMKGFSKLVDDIGGVYFDVPQNMYHPDANSSLSINLKKGPQRLYGREALQLVRYRGYTQADIKRIEVTQAFLTALFEQMLDLKNVLKIQEFAQNVHDNVETDLTLGEVAWLGAHIFDMERDKIRFHMLAGDPYAMYKGQSYVLVDAEESLKIINEFINPFTSPITEENIDIIHLRD